MSDTKMAIFGAGTVGLATATFFAKRDLEVTLCDPAPHARDRADSLGFTVEEPEKVSADAYLVCVSTPASDGGFDLSAVEAAVGDIEAAILKQGRGQLVLIRSTVPPGTTDRLAGSLAAAGLPVGEGLEVTFNPEFLRERSAFEDAMEPRLVLLGGDGDTKWSEDLYVGFEPMVTSSRTAEAAKLLANAYNAMKITFFNDAWRWMEASGADARAASDAVVGAAEGMWNPSYGTSGGRPFEGVCLPKDLAGTLASIPDGSSLLREVQRINREMGGP